MGETWQRQQTCRKSWIPKVNSRYLFIMLCRVTARVGRGIATRTSWTFLLEGLLGPIFMRRALTIEGGGRILDRGEKRCGFRDQDLQIIASTRATKGEIYPQKTGGQQHMLDWIWFLAAARVWHFDFRLGARKGIWIKNSGQNRISGYYTYYIGPLIWELGPTAKSRGLYPWAPGKVKPWQHYFSRMHVLWWLSVCAQTLYRKKALKNGWLVDWRVKFIMIWGYYDLCQILKWGEPFLFRITTISHPDMKRARRRIRHRRRWRRA